MVHKILSFDEPRSLSEMISLQAKNSQRNGRHGVAFHFPKVTKECDRRGCSYFGLKLYNGLPESRKEGLLGSGFKRMLRLSRINS